MVLIRSCCLLGVLIGLLASGTTEFSASDTLSLEHIANVSFGGEDPNAVSTPLLSPRMDFEQWRPLTGRGDPLRNDPTYDYEPPVLERVHYWADDSRFEREHFPDKKSEVLMLGVSSRKPSIASRPPSLPPRRNRRPPPKYEDFQYKLNENFPMTILVPPPPPPAHKPQLYSLGDEKIMIHSPPSKPTEQQPQGARETTTANSPEHLTSSYALQESNLIYQSSTTHQNWEYDLNETKSINNAVSSDYAGWGPTTPINDSDGINDTINFIFKDNFDYSKQPYAFYKPMLSEAPPPPQITSRPLLLPTFVPTALPPTEAASEPAFSFTESPSSWPTAEALTETPEYNEETTTDHKTTFFLPTPTPSSKPIAEKGSLFDMLGSMISMPLVNGPDRPEDNLYAHASTNINVFKEHNSEDSYKLETMQTMQPPPISITTESTTLTRNSPFHPKPFSKKPSEHNHDPYLHMRFTTPQPNKVDTNEQRQPTTDTTPEPTYLIIQGHSKVKTYGSKPKPSKSNDPLINEIFKLNETNEVKHLHSTKEKINKHEKPAYRMSRSQNLKSLLDKGVGSIEIQEADVGIKYDVSDGSDVPVEIYRKGIVDSDVDIDDYSKNNGKRNRSKRQMDLEDLLPFDEDTIEEYVFDFLKGRRNQTGITGLIAQAVTSDAAATVDELEDDDDEDDDEDR